MLLDDLGGSSWKPEEGDREGRAGWEGGPGRVQMGSYWGPGSLHTACCRVTHLRARKVEYLFHQQGYITG